MKDICPELIKNINDEFEKNCIKDANMRALVKKIEAGTATYTDAYKYAEAVGTARANAFQSEISSEVLPDGKMYYNIAERVMTDSLGTDHEMIADFAEQVQKAINDNAGIRLKAQRADLDEDRIDGFVQRLASEDNVDNAKWLLNEPVKTHARSVVDDTVKKNAKFQHKAGIKAKVVRYGGSDCCKWCDGLTGEYIYPSVPREVFMRHDNCRCSLDYNGKKLTAYESGGVAHTFRDQGENEKLAARKAFSDNHSFQHTTKAERSVKNQYKLSAMSRKGSAETVRNELGYVSSSDVNNLIEYFKNEIRNEKTENAIIIQNDGKVIHYSGGKDSVNIFNANLNNAHILHNHPESNGIVSFGQDDFNFIKLNQSAIYDLCNKEYDYHLEVLKDISDLSYNQAKGMVTKTVEYFCNNADYQHEVMEALKENGFIQYTRTEKK